MLYSYRSEYPRELPDRIRLSNGTTRTNKLTFTDQEIADAGYTKVSDYPEFDQKVYKVVWDHAENNWVVSVKTTEELSADTRKMWNQVRNIRDSKINEVEWRINRYTSHVRLNLTPIDNISDLDNYVQQLRDVTLQEDPYNIVWPSLNEVENGN